MKSTTKGAPPNRSVRGRKVQIVGRGGGSFCALTRTLRRPAGSHVGPSQRALGALKYTSFTIVIFFVLFMLGLFLQPGEVDVTNPDWYKNLFVDDSTPGVPRARVVDRSPRRLIRYRPPR